MPASRKKQALIVCDASPLIFLAKLDRLELIETVTRREAVVLQCVVDEVLSKRAMPVEAERLRNWLKRVRVEHFSGSLFPADSLSQSDQSSLAWAVENRADWILADERLLRRFAKDQGMGVIGFCGLLAQAVLSGRITRSEARSDLDRAIREHGFRISVELYQEMIRHF